MAGPLPISARAHRQVLTRRPWLTLSLLVALLAAVTTAWVLTDRRPPEWDHANHLERAVGCYRILSDPGRDRLREILDVSSFYPPIVPCAAGLLYFVFPIAPLTAQAVMLGFLAVGLAATFALGRHLYDVETGLLAALFLGTAPFVVFSLTNFQLDLPLAAMVAVSLYLLVRTDAFSRPGWCVALGAALGLGMITKPPFAGYLLPVFAWALWRGL
ncbi:MAG TPA: glycosyltransferase family 39 protein, partial [Terriglobales bacterium]|nr:glycosyltransferase family 39 protein [Terriglobales bacterium]